MIVMIGARLMYWSPCSLIDSRSIIRASMSYSMQTSSMASSVRIWNSSVYTSFVNSYACWSTSSGSLSISLPSLYELRLGGISSAFSDSVGAKIYSIRIALSSSWVNTYLTSSKRSKSSSSLSSSSASISIVVAEAYLIEEENPFGMIFIIGCLNICLSIYTARYA